jgi:hypothetical protein
MVCVAQDRQSTLKAKKVGAGAHASQCAQVTGYHIFTAETDDPECVRLIAIRDDVIWFVTDDVLKRFRFDGEEAARW